MPHVVASGCHHGLGVDEVNRYGRLGVLHEACRGIDVERCSDDDEQVGLLRVVGCHADVWHSLAEEYYVWAEQRAVAGLLAGRHVDVVCRHRAPVAWVVHVTAGARFHQFSVQVDYARAARHLVKVVHVLRHYGHVIPLFERGHEAVALVWLGRQQFFAQHVVKVVYVDGVLQPRLMRCHARHGIVLPQPVGVAESAQSALDGHSRTGKYKEFFHCFAYLEKLKK